MTLRGVNTAHGIGRCPDAVWYRPVPCAN